jgi:hypothetical protein
MENLLRGLLDLPNKPAVILIEAVAFSVGGMGGGGGRMHLPVAQYYGASGGNLQNTYTNAVKMYLSLSTQRSCHTGDELTL